MTGRRDRRAAARPAAARVRARRRALPVRAAGGDRAGAVRRGRQAVPDAVLRHVPAPRRRDLAARGGGWRRALDARGARRRRARREPRRRAGGAARAAARARRRDRRLDPRRQPQVPARARRVRARAPRLRARRPDPRGAARRSGPTPAVLPDVDVELARQQWEDGNRRVEAARADRRATAALSAQVDVVVAGCASGWGRSSRSPSSRTPTTAPTTGRATLLDDADPEARARREPGTVADAAFHALRARRSRLPRRESAGSLDASPSASASSSFVGRHRARRGAARQPDAGRDADARPHAASRCRSRRPRARRSRSRSRTHKRRFRYRQALDTFRGVTLPRQTRPDDRARLADARPGGEVPRRRPVDDPQVVRPGPRARLLHAGRPPPLPPPRPRAVPRPLRPRRHDGGPARARRRRRRAPARVHARQPRDGGLHRSARPASAEEALAAIEDQAPELVLLDVVMPGVDGWQMLQRMQERHGSIPVIMFSGQVDERPPATPSSAARGASSASRSTRSS